MTTKTQAPRAEHIALARLLQGAPIDANTLPEPLATVAREVIAANGSGNRVDAFRAAATAHGVDAEKYINAVCTVDPNATPKAERPIGIITADEILTKDFPEPVWAIPNLLPAGLCILAGAPKMGKSWLGLQIAFAIAAGGYALGEHVQRGAVLCMALEDTPRRLQDRLHKQQWTRGLDADFLTLGQFENEVGDLKNGGGERLANQIERRGYRLVVIDTLSRSVHGDQNDVGQMTRALTPIHEIANAHDCAVLLLDHHNKVRKESTDAIADILGSTAKGAMADTVWGLYRERGKAGAKLAITGREVEEKTLAVTIDWETGVWQSEGNADALALTERRQEILDALQTLGRAKLRDIAEAIDQDRGNTYRRIQDLINAGKVEVKNGFYFLS